MKSPMKWESILLFVADLAMAQNLRGVTTSFLAHGPWGWNQRIMGMITSKLGLKGPNSQFNRRLWPKFPSRWLHAFYSNIAVAGKWGPRNEDVFPSLMGIFQPAMLVYQRVHVVTHRGNQNKSRFQAHPQMDVSSHAAIWRRNGKAVVFKGAFHERCGTEMPGCGCCDCCDCLLVLWWLLWLLWFLWFISHSASG